MLAFTFPVDNLTPLLSLEKLIFFSLVTQKIVCMNTQYERVFIIDTHLRQNKPIFAG